MTDVRVGLKKKIARLERRRKHIRKKVFGTSERPRLVVFRSNRHIYTQIVDDENRRTITGCSTMTPALKDKIAESKGKTEQAKVIGEHIVLLAKENGINQVCFDRNGRVYHGRIKVLADAARSGGLKI